MAIVGLWVRGIGNSSAIVGLSVRGGMGFSSGASMCIGGDAAAWLSSLPPCFSSYSLQISFRVSTLISMSL